MIIALDGFKKKEVVLSSESRYQNTLVIGQKGTGKSEHVLLNMLYQDLLDKTHSLFAFTSKGDTSYKLYSMAKFMKRKVHIIKPEANTFSINFLNGEEQEVIQILTELFEQSNQEVRSNTDRANALLLRNAIKVVKRTLKEEATLEALYDVISNQNQSGKHLIHMFAKTPVDDAREQYEQQEIVAWFLKDYYKNDMENSLFELCSDLRFKLKEILDYQLLYELNSVEEDLPDFNKVLRNKEIVIVDCEETKYGEYSMFVSSYLLLKMKRLFLTMDTVNSFIYIDDFYKYYPVCEEFLEDSQIKEIGLTLFIQETTQLNRYPRYEQVIHNNVSNIILLERISHYDYNLFKAQMNGELLNRKKGEIVYKIINKDGSYDSTSGTTYSIDSVFTASEKFLDYKKELTKKRRKQVKVQAKAQEKQVIQPPEETIVEEMTKPTEEPAVKATKTFEQFKREGKDKEYLSPSEVFSEYE